MNDKDVGHPIQPLAEARFNASLQGILETRHTFRQYFTYIFPFMLVIGIFGILVTMLTIRRFKDVVNKSTRVWLLGLLVSDLYISVSGWTFWLDVCFGINIRLFARVICTTHSFLSYFAVHLNTWLQVSLCIERLVAIIKPLHAKTLLTKQHTVAAIILLTCVIGVTDGFMLYYITLGPVERMEYNLSNACYMPDDITRVIYHIDVIVGGAIPFPIIILASAIIAVAGRRSIRNRINGNTASGRSNLCMRREVTSHMQMCFLLVVLNTLFIACNAPLLLFWMFHSHPPPQKPDYLRVELLLNGLSALSYVNNLTNWMFFTISGAKFRTRFYQTVSMSMNRNRHSTRLKSVSVGNTVASCDIRRSGIDVRNTHL